MTPTLNGRIQTRLFLILVVGSVWTILIGPILPRPDVVGLGELYARSFAVLFLVALFGVGWELLYHALQQRRWEKDWPTLYGLLEMVPEGILLAFCVVPTGLAPGGTFFVHFVSTWIVTWLWANGPMRVLNLHWRFDGGRLV